ncbi:MAG: ABC transporter permease [Actinomycetota bacterium]
MAWQMLYQPLSPAQSGSPKKMINQVFRYRDLLYMLTWREIRIRYKQSVMGFLWAMLMPLMIVVGGIVVREALAVSAGKGIALVDVMAISVKGLYWAFFAGALRFATLSLVANSSLVTKIYFPREILPLSSVLAALFDFAVAAGFLAILTLFFPSLLSLQLLWTPVIFLVLFMITLGISLLLACANLFFRDVKYLVEVIITFGVLFTPVFYSAHALGKWAPLILVNPVSAVLESLNDVIVGRHAPDMFWLGCAAVFGVLGTFISWKIFQKAEPSFAQEI